jgi:membrane-associated protease RseP (regulator of RpoE activity)
MHKNDFAKFFTPFWPEFWLREIVWLFMIAFSVTLFNMLPLPVFDGDRIAKELINWGFGEEFKTTRKKTDKVLYKKDEKDIDLTEYRVEKVDSVKIVMGEKFSAIPKSEIILAEDQYSLIDKIGDGFKDTISLNLPEYTSLDDGSHMEITYEYWHDEKRKVKRSIINIIRFITLFMLVGNIVLSFVKFGDLIFWF